MSTQNRVLVLVGVAFLLCHFAHYLIPRITPNSAFAAVPWMNAVLGSLFIIAGACGVERLKEIQLKLGRLGTYGFGLKRDVPAQEDVNVLVKSAVDHVAPDEKKRVETLEDNAEKRPDNKRSAADYLVLATRAWRNRRFHDAVDLAYKGLSLNPDDKRLRATLLLRLATAYKGIDLSDLRENLFRQSIEVDRKFAWPHYNLGIFHWEAGRIDEAERAYRRAIELEPDYAKARNNLGILLKETGRPAEAEEQYRKAISAAPTYAKARYNLGVLLQENGNTDEAELQYREAILHDPDNSNAHNSLGTILQERKDYESAEKEYREASRLNPRDAKPHNNLGDLLKDTGRLDAALEEYKTAVFLDEDLAEARDSLKAIEQTSSERPG